MDEWGKEVYHAKVTVQVKVNMTSESKKNEKLYEINRS
jgi:hypothetical protein